MDLTEKDRKFISKRVRLVKVLPIVIIIYLCLLIGWYVWECISEPLIYNPFAVLSALKNNTIPETSLIIMAGLYPLFLVISMFLLIFIMVFALMAISSEKKYIEIIQRLGGPTFRTNLSTFEKEKTAQPDNPVDYSRSG
ncbi:MAG: hypothetical protein JW914_00230 [Syntrophaceae bacterium]|nr:hypothetical protein [Syntrophaceae bacterium]